VLPLNERNWARNYVYRATVLHRPASMEALRELLAGAPRIRVIGSRHSFTDIADSAELVSLDALPGEVEIDVEAMTVSVPGAMRYGELAKVLGEAGLALGNLASLPHISVAGAVATATHGSGDRNRNMAGAVAAVELVTSDGEIVRAARGDAGFDGMVVSVGALGAVTRITLDVEPAYDVRQRVFEGLSWDALYADFDAITAAGYSVSVFSRWGETTDQVWIKERISGSEAPRAEFFGAPAATVDRHPILGIDPVHATPQLGVPGPWWERLAHFRLGFTPSAGDELQSEYLVARERGVEAIDAVRAQAAALRPLLQVAEIRTVAADTLWLSPQYERDTVGIHFTWTSDETAVRRALVDLEAALLPLGARPHWGKLFLAGAATLAERYPRLDEFAALAARLDPRGAFRNGWLERHVLG
jgi:xylitol oxidase